MSDDLPHRIKAGFDELEDNPFIIPDPDKDVGLADLEDLDGVGPALARKLRDAGIQEPSDLYGLGQDEIAAINGVGPKRAARIRRQLLQRGNRDERKRTFKNEQIQQATRDHAERSEAAREADESFNAEQIALNYDQWRSSPNRFDMPGVDTVPRDRRLERTREVAGSLSEKGALEEVNVTPSGPDKGRSVTGLAAGRAVYAASARDDPESTVAHELGHIADAADEGRAGITRDIFGGTAGATEDEQTQRLREEGARLASRRRSLSLRPEVIVEKAEDRDFGGGGFDEVFADAFAEFVEEPRRARAEAPQLAEKFDAHLGDDLDVV